jgi:peptidyl-tRNA hydrolase, PTH2 family
VNDHSGQDILMSRDTKQVIVIRKDLKMRRGKEITQGAHAAMMWLTLRLQGDRYDRLVLSGAFTGAEESWLKGNFRKITVRVDSEEQLLDVQRRAEDAGLVVHLVVDDGLTEFGNVPTRTALAIGPDYDDRIDPVTKDLELY